MKLAMSHVVFFAMFFFFFCINIVHESITNTCCCTTLILSTTYWFAKDLHIFFCSIGFFCYFTWRVNFENKLIYSSFASLRNLCVRVCKCCNRCPHCFGFLAASGDRSYQDNMMLFGEIGFLRQSDPRMEAKKKNQDRGA